ncbi:MAG: hypothetical protein JSW59_10460 [Phycisphaerales bacterium]|nr:MAG: hypothetical protein JSW59_10460 [Phycisphaerales bacterium]
MDNFDVSNFGAQDLNEPIPLDEPIPFDNIGPGESGVSHAPLDLGGGSKAQAPKTEEPKAVPPKAAARPKPSVVTGGESREKLASGDRIIGMKTFFTKLHAGAISFLEEQIARWLKDNPDVIVKRTNVVTGDVVGKKTEPNIIITVWY